MNQPRGRNAKLALLVTARHGVGILEPFAQGGVVTVNEIAAREKTVTKSRARRSLNHAFEAAARNEFNVQVDPFFNHAAKHARLLAIGSQTFGHAILLDEPEGDGIPAPDRLLRKA